ncbi:MAG TPA: DUF4097 family beta strand repeat-containing protein [Longimicrobiales bacterium]
MITRRMLSTLLVLCAAPVGAAAQNHITLQGDAVLYDLAGQVRLEPGPGSAVVVELQPQGADAARLRVESGQVGGWRTVRVVFPGDEVVYQRLQRGNSSELDVRADGSFGDRGFWREAGITPPSSGEGRRVRVRGSGSGLHAFADAVVRVPAGRRVAIFLGVGRVDAENIGGRLWVGTASADVALTGTRGGAHISTGSGDLRLSDVAGDIVAATGSGDVTVQGARTGSFNLSTGSGDVTGERLQLGELTASTGSGDVKLRGVSAPRATISTGSGNVEVGLAGTLSTLKVSTGSGDARVALPAGTGAQIRLSSGNGDLESDVPLELTRRRHGLLEGRMGNGAGSIEVSTGSGSVTLTKS